MAAGATSPTTATADDTTAEQLPRWRYIGEEQIVYTHIPVTPDQGDVIEWPTIPADDGRWRKAGRAKVTRRPDNWQPDPATPLDGQDVDQADDNDVVDGGER